MLLPEKQMKPITIAKLIYDENFKSVLSNLELFRWSLQNTRDVVLCNEELLDEFEHLYESEKNVDDFGEKISDVTDLMSQQQFILVMSYYEYYLVYLKALVLRDNFEDDYSPSLQKYLLEDSNSLKELAEKIDIANNKDLVNIHLEIREIRNALMHRDNKTKNDSINILKDFIDKNLYVIINYSKFIELIYKVNILVDKIDLIVINKFPELNIFKNTV